MEEVKSLKNLAKKMISIMDDVSYIQKAGYNKFQNYRYAKESDIAAAFANAMKKHNVFMFTSILNRECTAYQTEKQVKTGEKTFLVTVKLQVTFVDAESGERFTVVFFGDGSDKGDKAVYKAITGAQKYALMKTFLCETGDDPERDENNTQKNKNSYNNQYKNNENSQTVRAAANNSLTEQQAITKIESCKNLEELKAAFVNLGALKQNHNVRQKKDSMKAKFEYLSQKTGG